MQVLTRSFDAARTGANTRETILTPAKVGENLLRKLFSLHFVSPASNTDPSLEGRLEAQPLYFGGLDSGGRKRNVVYVCTMPNNVWAFDADDGKPIWANPINLGPPVKPNGTEIDMFRINNMWGIFSTPVIDPATNTMYVVSWSSPSGHVADAVHRLHAVRITDGHETKTALVIDASAQAQAAKGETPAKFASAAKSSGCLCC
jgi:PQQ enzyme repeat